MGDQRRISWPWRKLARLGSSASKSDRDKSSRFSPSQLVTLSNSPCKAEECSPRDIGNSWNQEAAWHSAENARIGEAIALREQAEESLRALKQELSTLMKEMVAKEALVKQHQKVANEAVSGWEKAQEEVLALKQELRSASQRSVILEDRIAHLDGALKECMRQVRHVRDEQEAKVQEVIACKARELAEVKADMDAQKAELQRRLLESDAQNNAMAKSLQDRARKILDANEAKTKAEEEVEVMQVRLSSAEKDISSLQYELHLLSKELEIRNEEVAYCKKTADVAHKQHLDNVQKVAKVEADCQRLRILLKKKLPGPAAIAQMRKEVEGLPIDDSMSTSSATAVGFKRRPSRSYASSTISFANSHQHTLGTGKNNRNVEVLRDRLAAMEEENKLLKEALSKRIGELQASWLLCAKTASKLSIAEDHLESLQGTPRAHAKTNRFDLASTTTETLVPGIDSVSDVGVGFGNHDNAEEASCAESWASALMDELDHFKKEKIITKEAIKEVTEPYKTRDSLSSVDVDHAVLHEEGCPMVNGILPIEAKRLSAVVTAETGTRSALQHQLNQVENLGLLCKDLDRKLGAIEGMLRGMVGKGCGNEELIELVDVARRTFSELEKEIQDLKSSSWQSLTPDHVVSIAETIKADCKRDDVWMPQGPMKESIAVSMRRSAEGLEPAGLPLHTETLNHLEEECKMDVRRCVGDVSSIKGFDGKEEEPMFNDCFSSQLTSVLSMLVSLLDRLPRGPEDAMLDADCVRLAREKEDLESCKDRFLGGQGSLFEILARVAALVCRACHVESHELESMVASSMKADMQVSVNAAGFLTALPRIRPKAPPIAELDSSPGKPLELDAEVARSGAKQDGLELGGHSDVTEDEHHQVGADVAASFGGPGNAANRQDARQAYVDAHLASAKDLDDAMHGVDGDLAARLARLAGPRGKVYSNVVHAETELDADMAGVQSTKVQEATDYHKMLHSQLLTKDEELQPKLQKV